MQQGPVTRAMNPIKETVCNGCEYLDSRSFMCGHKTHTMSFGCQHPSFSEEKDNLFGVKGKLIHFNKEGGCNTPSWCPFLKPKAKDNEIKPQYKWECLANHLPKWMNDLDISLSIVMSKTDHKLVDVMLDRYNELTEKEESPNEDGHSLYGVAEEKQELVEGIIKIHEKYKEAAIKLDAETPDIE